MQKSPIGSCISTPLRRTRTLLALTTSAAICAVPVDNAFAFKLFGWNIFGKSEEPAQQVVNPVRYTVSLDTTNANDDVKNALQKSSLLIADKDKPVSGDLGVVIKARDDRDRLIAALYENARYGGVVTITINGTDLDALPPNPTFAGGKPVAIGIKVVPGPLFHLGKITLLGDAARLDPKTYSLIRGGDASSLTILKAGDKMVSDFKKQGHPLAKVVRRDVTADHATNLVDVSLDVDAGPVAPIGTVAVTGAKEVDPNFIRYYSRIRKGDRYSPEELKKATDRLRKLGTFASVTIKEPDKLAPDGSLPTTIEVAEGKMHYFGFGAQYATIDGAGLTGYWGNRNFTGRADSLRVEGTISRLGGTSSSSGSDTANGIDYEAGIKYSRPGTLFPSGTLDSSLIAKTEHLDSYAAKTITARSVLSYELNDIDSVSAGGEVAYERSEDGFGKHTYLTFAIPLGFVRDARDDKLNPTRGYRATVDLEPSYEAMSSTIFSSVEGSISGYRGVGSDNQVIFAGKLALGSLLGADNLENIPSSRRFYLGGGGSVRGYGYREITVYNDDGKALGGRSYVTASAEARVKITKAISLVPFVDAGSVTDTTFPTFSDFRIGAGLGVRYATPFGPIRLDVAVPLKKYNGGSSFGIYAGIGQAF